MADNRRPLPFSNQIARRVGETVYSHVSVVPGSEFQLCSEICPRYGVKLKPVLWEEVYI